MKKIIIAIVFFCLGVAFLWYIMCYPVKLHTELIATCSTKDIEKLSHWKTICTQDDVLLSRFVEKSSELSRFDFQKNNLIVSYGKEIKSISYKRISSFQHPLNHKVYLGSAEYGNSDETTVYFYKIKKINVIYNIFIDVI